jgi:hypothetical protein
MRSAGETANTAVLCFGYVIKSMVDEAAFRQRFLTTLLLILKHLASALTRSFHTRLRCDGLSARERVSEREGQRERVSERASQRERESARERVSERESQRERESARERVSERESQRERVSERESARERVSE